MPSITTYRCPECNQQFGTSPPEQGEEARRVRCPKCHAKIVLSACAKCGAVTIQLSSQSDGGYCIHCDGRAANQILPTNTKNSPKSGSSQRDSTQFDDQVSRLLKAQGQVQKQLSELVAALENIKRDTESPLAALQSRVSKLLGDERVFSLSSKICDDLYRRIHEDLKTQLAKFGQEFDEKYAIAGTHQVPVDVTKLGNKAPTQEVAQQAPALSELADQLGVVHEVANELASSFRRIDQLISTEHSQAEEFRNREQCLGNSDYQFLRNQLEFFQQAIVQEISGSLAQIQDSLQNNVPLAHSDSVDIGFLDEIDQFSVANDDTLNEPSPKSLRKLYRDLPRIFDFFEQELLPFGAIANEKKAEEIIPEGRTAYTILTRLDEELDDWQREHGFQRIPGDEDLGMPVDPSIHHVERWMLTDEPVKHRTVAEVLKRGYRYIDRAQGCHEGVLIRKATVLAWKYGK